MNDVEHNVMENFMYTGKTEVGFKGIIVTDLFLEDKNGIPFVH